MSSRGNIITNVDDDLSQLEKDIRQLKIEFEQFFGGGRKRPPNDTQWRVESLVKRYSERIAQVNFAQRFRFNNLASTYAKYQDMWRKKMAQREAGTEQHHFGAAAKAIEAERARQAGKRPAAPARAAAGSFSAVITDPERERAKLEGVYKKLIEARQQTGESAGAPSLSDFAQFVKRKTDELRKKGASAVEYTVTIEGGKVKLKARTGS